MIRSIVSGMLMVISMSLYLQDARAEFGDVVLNNYSDEAAVNPVVFPHWFHRIRYTCKACHADLNIRMEAGANKIKMSDIMEGQFCGACHDGETAWSVENCELCHSGKPGIKTSVQRSQLHQMMQTKKQPEAATANAKKRGK